MSGNTNVFSILAVRKVLVTPEPKSLDPVQSDPKKDVLERLQLINDRHLVQIPNLRIDCQHEHRKMIASLLLPNPSKVSIKPT
tara:strand:- start:69 stop:317 length:249 start_codon:yes stop_codon:yes gene_type:complete